jgi:glycosyltransferase involved in cell wall biosynthesis
MMLSVVVPAYRQAGAIKTDLGRICAVLDGLELPYEVIVVVDGHVDGTLEEAAALRSERVRVLGYPRNRGKGFAVRHGMQVARGDLIGFLDAGGDLDPGGLAGAVRLMLASRADVVVGSKRHPASRVHYPLLRRWYSSVYQFLAWVLFGFNVRDTQAGLKLFRREVVVQSLPLLSVDRYAFDVEFLAVARMLGYRRFEECPIEVRLVFGSSIGLRSILSMLWDTTAVFVRLRVRRSYQRRRRAALAAVSGER